MYCIGSDWRIGMDSFNLLREDNSFIENEYQNNNSNYLGVIFSGIGYTLGNPLLYYSRNILIENKIDYFGINFGYTKNENYKSLNQENKNKYFINDNKIIINKILELRKNYNQIFLIGKSLGTGTIRQCIKIDTIKNVSVLILLTPPGVEWENTINEIKDTNIKTLVIGSLRDKLYSVKNLSEIHGRKHIKILELEEGDHSLETGNFKKDIEQLKMIMEATNEFIKENILTN